MNKKKKRKFSQTHNEDTSNKFSQTSEDDSEMGEFLGEFENCEWTTLELHKSKLLLELEVFKQSKPLIHSKQENIHLKISLLEYRQNKLIEEIRLLRTELNDVFPTITIKQEAKEDSENIAKQKFSHEIIVEQINSKEKNNDEVIADESSTQENTASKSYDQSERECNSTINNVRTQTNMNCSNNKLNKAKDTAILHILFKGVKVKLVNYILAKHGEEILIETIKRITCRIAKSISDIDTEVLNVYLMNSKKITILSIHSAPLHKSLFISKRHYLVKWKRKPANYIKETPQPVLVDDDEELKSTTPLVFLKPRSEGQNICERKKFRIGLLHTLTVNELFELVSENPFEIRPLNGDVVFAKYYMDILKPIVLKTLGKQKNVDRIPNISLLASSSIKNMHVVNGVSNIANSKLTYVINNIEMASQTKKKSELSMTIDLTEPLQKPPEPVELYTSVHPSLADKSLSVLKCIPRITPLPLNESLDTFEISDGE